MRYRKALPTPRNPLARRTPRPTASRPLRTPGFPRRELPSRQNTTADIVANPAFDEPPTHGLDRLPPHVSRRERTQAQPTPSVAPPLPRRNPAPSSLPGLAHATLLRRHSRRT